MCGGSKIARRAPAHVGLLENGSVKRPDMNTASSVAAALGTSMDWLWTGAGDPPTEAESNAAVAAALDASDPNDVAPDPVIDRGPEYAQSAPVLP